MNPAGSSNASPRPNRWERRPVLAWLAVALAMAVLAEGGLRVAGPAIFDFVIQARQVHRYSPRWKVDLVPSTTAHLWLPGRDPGDPLFNFVVTTDPAGQRTYDRPRDHRPAASDAPRYIHAIGDSFTLGWGVDYASSYPALLEALLPEPWRVLNQGVDGFGTIGATEKSMALWQRYPAALAVYLFYSNDFEDDETALAVQSRAASVHTLWEGLDVLRRHSYVANVPFAVHWYAAFHGRTGGAGAPGSRLALEAPRQPITVEPPPAAGPPQSPNASMRQIVRYQRFVTEHGARLLVLVLSGGDESLRFYRYCREQGIDAVIIDVPEAGRLKDDGHFNAFGNHAVARLVRERVPK